MGKLSERIRRLGRTETNPMGFLRTASTPATPSLLLFLRGDTSAGTPETADGVISTSTGASKERSTGLRGYAGTDALTRDSGADFVVIGPSADLSSLGDDLSLVIEIDESWPDAILRAIDQFSPEAAYLRLNSAVTVERLLAIRRIASTAGPVLLETELALESDALRLLRDAGVAGLVLTKEASLKTMRERINALPPRKRKRDEHSDAVLPAASARGHDEEDDEDG